MAAGPNRLDTFLKGTYKKKCPKNISGTFLIWKWCNNLMVNHRVIQVETLLEVIEDMEPKLKVLGIVEENGTMTYKTTDKL